MSSPDGLLAAAKERALNLLRHRSIIVSRHYKRLFAPNGEMTRDAEIVLSDLREFCRANQSGFNIEPLEMARLAGRREAFLRFINFLNLDEAAVRKLMEVDDGL